MLRQVFLFAIICASVNHLFAQTIINGKVNDVNGLGLSNVNILIQNPADSTIIAFGHTNESGTYSVKFSSPSIPHLLVSISGLEVKKQHKKVENRSQSVDFYAEFEVTQIAEVVVKANKIWQKNDTINYRVSSYLDSNDVVIADVLEKMPGISVSENGTITYRGRKINKFYIENMDLLKERYDIATKNLQVKDIATVQVLENHQPIKMLDGIQISTDAAINIKLKEGAKNIFTMQALLGAGYDKDVLWLGEVIGTLFNRNNQNITTFRTSNTGDTSDNTSSSRGQEIENLSLTGILSPSQPSIRKNRYFDRTEHSAGTNQLFRLNNGAEFTTHVNFTNSREKRVSDASTTYRLPNTEAVIIEENLSTNLHNNILRGGLSYKLNKEHQYIGNETNIRTEWIDNKGIVSSDKIIDQQYRSQTISIFNSFVWGIKNNNEQGIAIIFDNAYRTQPNKLTIRPGLYPQIFNEGEAFEQITQDIKRSTLRSTLDVKGLSAFSFGALSFDPRISLKMDYETLASDIYKNRIEQVIAPEWRNDMTSILFNSAVGIDVRYNYRNLKINIALPLTYRHTHLDYKISKNNNMDVGRISFLPSFRLVDRYRNIQWELSSAFYNSAPTISQLYSGFILKDYRSINRYTPQFFDTNIFDTFGSLGYKSIQDMFFINTSLNYSRQWSKGIYAEKLQDQLSVVELIEHPNKQDRFFVSSEINKGFYWKNLTIALSGYWGTNHIDLLRQTQAIQYQGYSYGMRSKLDLTPWKWLSTNYRFDWNTSRGQDNTGEQYKPIHNVAQALKILVKITDRLTLTSTAEQYYNNMNQGNQHFYLADLSLVYQTKAIRYTLDCTNIMNTRNYTTYAYGTMTSFYSSYYIRPRAVLLTMRFKVI